MNTLLLDLDSWDLTVVNGNIALATGKYAIAQDVASACRTFRDEVWYDLSQGIPYLLRGTNVSGAEILGQNPPVQYIKYQLVTTGETVPDVTSITCYLTGPDKATRQLGGQLQIFDDLGNFVGAVQSDVFFGGAPWYVMGATDGAFSP
jgi:hypothetical protein